MSSWAAGGAGAPPGPPLEPLRALLCTAPPDVAEVLAKRLVERKLAACVNVLPGVRSVYAWKGEVQVDDECLLVVKTRASLVPDVTAAILELHPYDMPEVVALALEGAEGNPAYLAWLVAETARPS